MPFITQGKTNWKFLLIVIILTAVAGGGILWCTSKQEVLFTEFPEIKIPKGETADWKTYGSEEYGFEIKIPPSWEVVIGGTAIKNFDFWGPDDGDYAGMTVAGRTEETDLLNFANNFYGEDIIESVNLIEFNGYPAAHIQKTSGIKNGGEMILLNNGFIYGLPFIGVNMSDNLRKIYSTFRFIEDDETADWKSHKIVTDDSGRIVVAKINYPTEFKGVFMDLHIVDNQMSLLSKPKIVNGYPNYLPGSYEFMARTVSFNDDILGEYGFGDPRIIFAEQGYEGPTWLDSVDFSLITPYFKNSNTINIFSATKLMLSVDISYLTSEQ